MTIILRTAELIKTPHQPNPPVQMKHGDIAGISIRRSEAEPVSTPVPATNSRIYNISNCCVYEPGADACEKIHSKLPK